MPSVTYTALRNVQPGHTVGAQYSIDVRLMQLQPQNATMRDQSISISGVTQTTVHRRERHYDCMTLYLDEGTQEYLDIYEFLSSVDAFENFTFDEKGSVATPDSPSAVLLLDNFSQTRVGTSSEWQFSFSMRTLP